MKADPRKRGAWGENIALEYLKKKDYTILTTRFRSRFGEIDIIAKNKEYLTFTEVKTRKNANFASAGEYVSKVKQRKIIKTAFFWLSRRATTLQPRFDVIEVYAADGENTKEPQINHIENAFSLN